MKKTFLLFILISFCFALFAADNTAKTDESVVAYRNALEAMDALDYGTALKYSEDAILYRKQRIEKQISTLKNSLSAKRVQAAGERFEPILNVLENRGENETAGIINFYLKKKSKEYFNDSINNLLDYMESCMAFPEAHKLIGDIYKLEGEYVFAEDYYRMALDNAEVLDIPDEKYEILYMLADISRLKNDLPKMEVRLLNILTDDSNYKNNALKRSMKETISGNKVDSFDKFFNLFRADSYVCINAYNQLAEYYHDVGESQKALEFASLAAITSFTRINEILESRNSIYEFENFEVFIQEASFYDDVIEWGSRNQVWKSFNILARFAHEAGYKNFSLKFLKILAQWSPEKYWQRDAVLLLENTN